MGRLNIKHPKTGLYRCWSTVVDDWVSEWLSEEDYKQWLIEEAINQLKYDLDQFGIKVSLNMSYDELQYKKLLHEFCNSCSIKDCDNCIYNLNFKYYKERVQNGEIENYLKMEFTE